MDRYSDLRNKASLAFFQSFKERSGIKEGEAIPSIVDEDVDNDWNMGATTFGPLPAHFSWSNTQPSTNDVHAPEHIIVKGAPHLRD